MAVVHETQLFAELALLKSRIAALEALLTSGAGAPAGTGNDRQWYYDTTNDRLYVSDGAGWIIMYEPWQGYTPTTTGISFGTGGSSNGSYRRSGGDCEVIIHINLGASSAGVLSTGPTFEVPFNPFDTATTTEYVLPIGTCILYDANGALHNLIPIMLTAKKVEPRYNIVSGSEATTMGQITNTVPITIETNDLIRAHLRYAMSSNYS